MYKTLYLSWLIFGSLIITIGLLQVPLDHYCMDYCKDNDMTVDATDTHLKSKSVALPVRFPLSF